MSLAPPGRHVRGTTTVIAGELLRRGRALSDGRFLDLLYDTLLGRPRDAGEEAASVAALGTGDLSRLRCITLIGRSAEALARHARLRVHWSFLMEAGESFVADCYWVLLGRDADASGLDGYGARLAAGEVTRAQVILELAGSPEAAEQRFAVEGLDRLARAVTLPLVHIVIGDRGWVQERQAREIERRCLYVTVGTAPSGAPLQHFMPYTGRRPCPGSLESAFFTHLEPDPAGREAFTRAAAEVDLAVYMSERYGEVVRRRARRAVRVEPGLDLAQLPLAPVRIGVVGRTYDSRRKGEDLIRAVMDVPGLAWHFTGSGWPQPGERVADHDLGAFYAGMDVILIASSYEGGPMCLLEALACGKPVIAPPVGFVEEFPHTGFPVGDAAALRGILVDLVAERQARRDRVSSITWDRWAEVHDGAFQALLKEHGHWPAPAAPLAPGGLRIALALHPPEGRDRLGGPSRRVARTAAALRRAGHVEQVVHDALPSGADTDVLHVFNVWEPDSALALIRAGRSHRLPVVLSPIFLDLSTERLAQAVPGAFEGAVGFGPIAGRLRALVADHAADGASQAERIEHHAPGFLAKVREMVALVDHVVFLSQHERDMLAGLGIVARAHSLVANGTDPAVFATATPALFRATHGLEGHILSIGHLEPRKNQLTLVHACRDLMRPIALIGGGRESIYGRTVQRFAPPWTSFLGRIDDDGLLASAIAGAAVFVLPSWAEGAPLAALEACASGVPLVLSDRSAEREYFGGLADYCDPGDAEGIAAAVARAIETDTPALRKARRQLVVDRYSWDAVAEQTLAAYGRSIQAHRRRLG